MTSLNVSKGISNQVSKANDSLHSINITSKKCNKFIKWCEKTISSPEQRLILGITAMMTQPFIDYYNKDVDENTRKSSTEKTIAKIIVGTFTGVAIRDLTIKLAKKFTNVDKVTENGVTYFKKANKNSFFTPKNITNYSKDANDKYTKAMGTFLATFIMLFTNFIIDAPLTNLLFNKIHDIGAKKNKEKEIKNES